MAEPIEWKPYRPSNGTEGAIFFDGWCSRCAKDLPMSTGKDFDSCAPGETCELIANSMAYKITDPQYPKEWLCRWLDSGALEAKCTGFVEYVEPVDRGPSVAVRDTLTKELF